MEEREHPELHIDPKVIAALISAFVSIVTAMIPVLSDTDRNIFLVSAAFLIAFALMGVCVVILYQKRLYWAIGLLCAVILCTGVFTFFAKQVVPAPSGLVYVDTTVSVYAGTGERVFRDGLFTECAFVSPTAMSVWQDRLYVADSDRVRCLENGEVRTEPFPSSRYNALLVRNLEADLYVLAENRQMESGAYYNFFVRIRNGEAEIVSEPFELGAFSSSVSDFAFSNGGVLWFIRLYNAPGESSATLEKLSYDRDADRYGPPEWVMDFHYEAADMRDARMTFDSDDNLYITVPARGVILRLGRDEQECRVFAGQDGEQSSNDRGPFTFSYPTALLTEAGRLYVLDNGAVRRIDVDGDKATACETLAGIPAGVMRAGKTNLRSLNAGESVAGELFYFPADERASLTFDSRGRLLLSDPDNSFLYQIWEN